MAQTWPLWSAEECSSAVVVQPMNEYGTSPEHRSAPNRPGGAGEGNGVGGGVGVGGGTEGGSNMVIDSMTNRSRHSCRASGWQSAERGSLKCPTTTIGTGGYARSPTIGRL